MAQLGHRATKRQSHFRNPRSARRENSCPLLCWSVASKMFLVKKVLYLPHGIISHVLPFYLSLSVTVIRDLY